MDIEKKLHELYENALSPDSEIKLQILQVLHDIKMQIYNPEVLKTIPTNENAAGRIQDRTVEEKFNGRCNAEMSEIGVIAGRVKYLMEHPVMAGVETHLGQGNEMKANIMLAYRHLEDARMRIGKILQAAGQRSFNIR